MGKKHNKNIEIAKGADESIITIDYDPEAKVLEEATKKSKAKELAIIIPFVALFIAFVVLCSIFIVPKDTQSDPFSNYYYHKLDNGDIVITGIKEVPLDGIVNIPEGTTKIDKEAFYLNNELQYVIIPRSVKIIGNSAFERCNNLREVYINGELETLGESAFENCINLEIVTIEPGLTSISKKAFYWSGLKTISIPNTVTRIEEEAFYECGNLSEIIMSNNLEYIGMAAFSNCERLNSFTIPKSLKSISNWVFVNTNNIERIDYLGSELGWYAIDFGIGNDVIKNNLNIQFAEENNSVSFTLNNNGSGYEVRGLSAADGEIVIPNSYRGLPVVSVDFYNCPYISSVTIPNSVTSIYSGAFYYCTQLETIVMPNSIMQIDEGTFAPCNSLKHVIYKGSSTLFNQVIVEPNNDPFINAHIEYKEEDDEFLNYELNYNGYDGYTIKGFLDSNDNRETLVIPTSYKGLVVSAIDGGAFAETNIKTLIIPSNISIILDGAFHNCSSLTTVYWYTNNCSCGCDDYPIFGGCAALMNLYIGKDVTQIPENAFKGIVAMTAIRYLGNIEQWNSLNIQDGNEPLYIMSNVTVGGMYFSCNGNNGYDVTCIGRGVFMQPADYIIPSEIMGKPVTTILTASGCVIESIIIPKSIIKIKNDAFGNCFGIYFVYYIGTQEEWNLIDIGIQNDRLTDANINFNNPVDENKFIYELDTINNAYIVVGLKDEYKSCTDLIIPLFHDNKPIIEIGDMAFAHCTSLKSITIPNSVTMIGINAFSYCSSLIEITIPDNVKELGDSTFLYCTSMTNATIGSGITSIGFETFYGCSSLETIEIPNNITSIGCNAFEYCNFSSIVMSNSVTIIEAFAFYDCDDLTTINYLGTKEEWNAIQKASTWDEETLDYSIICTDGIIAK